jgi:hypothetical protein
MADRVMTVDTKQIKITLKLPFMFGFRMWLTVRLLKLAGTVSPTTIEITHVGNA